MRPALLMTILFLAMLSLPPTVSAQGFGADEHLHTIQNIEGSDMRLGHKTTLHFFLLGIYVTDDGYVLLPKGSYDKYIPISNTELRELQDDGSLPRPLPQYSIPVFEYIFGYSLWIFIGGMLAYIWIGQVLSNRRSTKQIKAMLANPDYKQALQIALNSDGNINEAVDYLHAKGIPLLEAQINLQLLLSKGTTVSM